MSDFLRGYRQAIADAKEAIENANINFAGVTAPWSWNYEVTDMLIQLESEVDDNKDAGKVLP